VNEANTTDTKPDDGLEITFAWGGRLGKVVASFSLELISRCEGDDKRFRARVAALRTCYYYNTGELPEMRSSSPLFKNLAELPPLLAEDVSAVVGSPIDVDGDEVDRNFCVPRYIEAPVR
jgi:hypothetical protein